MGAIKIYNTFSLVQEGLQADKNAQNLNFCCTLTKPTTSPLASVWRRVSEICAAFKNPPIKSNNLSVYSHRAAAGQCSDGNRQENVLSFKALEMKLFAQDNVWLKELATLHGQPEPAHLAEIAQFFMSPPKKVVG